MRRHVLSLLLLSALLSYTKGKNNEIISYTNLGAMFSAHECADASCPCFAGRRDSLESGEETKGRLEREARVVEEGLLTLAGGLEDTHY